MRVIDRTRCESRDKCLRSRWYGFEVGGRGVEPLVASVPLSTGIAVHHGLALLLQGSDVANAVKDALAVYSHEVTAAGVATIPGESTPQQLVIAEQQALCEALIRGWAIVRLPKLLADYTVEMVERELSYDLSPELKLLVRCDAVLRRRSDGQLFVWDFKTASSCDQRWRLRFRYDTLTLSQVLPVEQHFGELCGGVVIEGLVKGSRSEYPKGSGVWQQSSPLIYGWRSADGSDWQSRYEWQCSAEHWTKGKRPALCPGGKTHKLSGYYKAPVWKEFEGGVKGWIEHLLTVDPQLLEEQFVELPAILRSDWEVEEWKLTTTHVEAIISQHAQWVNELEKHGGDTRMALARLFPKNTSGGACQWCAFNGVCWGGATVDDPTMFKSRSFNHPEEAEYVRQDQ